MKAPWFPVDVRGSPQLPSFPSQAPPVRSASSGSLGLHPTNSLASFWEPGQAGSCSRPGNREGVNPRSQRAGAQGVRGGFPLQPSHESQRERWLSQSPTDPSLKPLGRAHHLVTMPSPRCMGHLPGPQTTARACLPEATP